MVLEKDVHRNGRYPPDLQRGIVPTRGQLALGRHHQEVPDGGGAVEERQDVAAAHDEVQGAVGVHDVEAPGEPVGRLEQAGLVGGAVLDQVVEGDGLVRLRRHLALEADRLSGRLEVAVVLGWGGRLGGRRAPLLHPLLRFE